MVLQEKQDYLGDKEGKEVREITAERVPREIKDGVDTRAKEAP